jgi:hypothetical protein
MVIMVPGPVLGASARLPATPPVVEALTEAVTEAPTEAAALAAADKSGRRVEVTSARSELTQVFAEPTGELTMESAVVPQRARRSDGTWAPIDLTLRQSGDRTWRPAVSVADVRFSAGGKGPLVALVRDGKTLAISWPEALPTPAVEGDSATYPEVRPGVDLVVRATWTGFTHVLVVKTPEAAANPAVRQIRLDVGGDARVTALPGGRLYAMVGEVPLAEAQPAGMWDSSVRAAGERTASDEDEGGEGSAATESTAAAPGDTARTARVETEVDSAGDLVLTPDPELLSADAVEFPVYVDPAWSTGKARWGFATSNNSNNTDTSVARVGRNPDDGVRYRSYFDFPLSAIASKHIESAYVQMRLDHSWSCGNTTTHMFHNGGMQSVPRTKWAPAQKRWLAAADSHANEGSGCSDSPQPDMTVNFNTAGVTSVVQQHVTAKGTTITMGFCACNADGEYESAENRWKKFFPNHAKLIVNFSSYPGKPTGLQVSGVACPTTGRMSIGTVTPTLSAAYPDADSTQAVAASFDWLEVPASGTYNDSTPRKAAPGNKSVPAGGRAISAALSGVQEGKVYAFRTRATDPAPYSLVSPWSAWCEFTVDTTVPPPPTITLVTAPTGPGTFGTFTFTSTASDVARFRYGWTTPPLKEVAATGASAKTATVTVTVPRYGQNTLYVYAIDGTANKGNDATLELTVDSPSPPVARWHLETRQGADPAKALADREPEVAGDTPLVPAAAGSDVGWKADARLVGATTASFNATAGGAGGWLEASVPKLDTSASFSVSAWVRASGATGEQTVVGRDGGVVSHFRLRQRADGAWCFTLRARDTADAEVSEACGPVAAPGRWTHLAGVYDETESAINLYVDGALAAAVTPSAAWQQQWAGGWNAAGVVTVGRALDSAKTPSGVEPFTGEVADVRLLDRILVPHDFTGQRASDPGSGGIEEKGLLDPVVVGQWDLDFAVPCYEPGAPGTCESPDATTWDRSLSFSEGVDVGFGRRGDGLVFDATHWVDDPADSKYGKATQEYARSQRNTAGAGEPPQWRDAPVLRTDQSFSVSAWISPDALPAASTTVMSQDGTTHGGFQLGIRNVSGVNHWAFTMRDRADAPADAARSVMSAPLTADDVGRWVHLVGVFDAARGEIRLYVNGTPAGSPVARSMTPWQAGGALTVGRGYAAGAPTEWFIGGVDDVTAFQGALADASVSHLHEDDAVFFKRIAEGDPVGSKPERR